MHPKAQEVIRGFPKDVRDKLGQALFEIQQGRKLRMPQSRPLSALASGAEELRIRGIDGAFRVFYFTGSARGTVVFHAFVKKTQKTPVLEIELGRKRLREILYAG